MICRACQAAGKMYRIAADVTVLTTLPWAPEFDADTGLVHHHDPNVATVTWSCSNGHTWQTKSMAAPCWCGWTNEIKD